MRGWKEWYDEQWDEPDNEDQVWRTEPQMTADEEEAMRGFNEGIPLPPPLPPKGELPF